MKIYVNERYLLESPTIGLAELEVMEQAGDYYRVSLTTLCSQNTPFGKLYSPETYPKAGWMHKDDLSDLLKRMSSVYLITEQGMLQLDRTI